jgi:hypothetical protein
MKMALSLGNGQIRWSLRITPSIRASSMKRRKFRNNKNRTKVGWCLTSDHGLVELQSLKKLSGRIYQRIYNKIYRTISLDS